MTGSITIKVKWTFWQHLKATYEYIKENGKWYHLFYIPYVAIVTFNKMKKELN